MVSIASSKMLVGQRSNEAVADSFVAFRTFWMWLTWLPEQQQDGLQYVKHTIKKKTAVTIALQIIMKLN